MGMASTNGLISRLINLLMMNCEKIEAETTTKYYNMEKPSRFLLSKRLQHIRVNYENFSPDEVQRFHKNDECYTQKLAYDINTHWKKTISKKHTL